MTMADSDGIAPHQHQWHLLMKDGEEPRVMPNSSCAVCGLTPEAVANAAAIEMLLTRNEGMHSIIKRLVSLWLVTDDSRAPERLTYLYSRSGDVDVEALREEARALLAQEEAE